MTAQGGRRSAPETAVNEASSMTVAAEMCPVCGGSIEEGEGVTVYHNHVPYRLRCEHCADRFFADPDRYLAKHPAGCCAAPADDRHVSEWRCE